MLSWCQLKCFLSLQEKFGGIVVDLKSVQLHWMNQPVQAGRVLALSHTCRIKKDTLLRNCRARQMVRNICRGCWVAPQPEQLLPCVSLHKDLLRCGAHLLSLAPLISSAAHQTGEFYQMCNPFDRTHATNTQLTLKLVVLYASIPLQIQAKAMGLESKSHRAFKSTCLIVCPLLCL